MCIGVMDVISVVMVYTASLYAEDSVMEITALAQRIQKCLH